MVVKVVEGMAGTLAWAGWVEAMAVEVRVVVARVVAARVVVGVVVAREVEAWVAAKAAVRVEQ